MKDNSSNLMSFLLGATENKILFSPNPGPYQSVPFNLTGANGLPWKIRVKAGAVCAPPLTRPQGAPLTVILDGKRILGTGGRAIRI
jgi:hypothetical protein